MPPRCRPCWSPQPPSRTAAEDAPSTCPLPSALRRCAGLASGADADASTSSLAGCDDATLCSVDAGATIAMPPSVSLSPAIELLALPDLLPDLIDALGFVARRLAAGPVPPRRTCPSSSAASGFGLALAAFSRLAAASSGLLGALLMSLSAASVRPRAAGVPQLGGGRSGGGFSAAAGTPASATAASRASCASPQALSCSSSCEALLSKLFSSPLACGESAAGAKLAVENEPEAWRRTILKRCDAWPGLNVLAGPVTYVRALAPLGRSDAARPSRRQSQGTAPRCTALHRTGPASPKGAAAPRPHPAPPAPAPAGRAAPAPLARAKTRP